MTEGRPVTHARAVLVGRSGVWWTKRPMCGARKGKPVTTEDLKSVDCRRCRSMLRLRGDIPNAEEIDR